MVARHAHMVKYNPLLCTFVSIQLQSQSKKAKNVKLLDFFLLVKLIQFKSLFISTQQPILLLITYYKKVKTIIIRLIHRYNQAVLAIFYVNHTIKLVLQLPMAFHFQFGASNITTPSVASTAAGAAATRAVTAAAAPTALPRFSFGGATTTTTTPSKCVYFGQKRTSIIYYYLGTVTKKWLTQFGGFKKKCTSWNTIMGFMNGLTRQ